MDDLSTIDEHRQTSSEISNTIPGKLRSNLLKTQHSRLDYERRKSAADISSAELSSTDFFHSEQIRNQQQIEKSKQISPSWFRRRFTLFSNETLPTNRKQFLTEKSFSDLFRHKRPSAIAQLMEVNHAFTSIAIRFPLKICFSSSKIEFCSFQ